jgi:hypothetical protein
MGMGALEILIGLVVAVYLVTRDARTDRAAR